MEENIIETEHGESTKGAVSPLDVRVIVFQLLVVTAPLIENLLHIDACGDRQRSRVNKP